MAEDRPERLQIGVAVETMDYLKALAALGTHGPTPTAVARSLIEEGIRAAIKDKFITVRKPSESSHA